MTKKLLFIVCRGAWDAAAIVVPTGDPENAKRESLVLGAPLPMTDFWGLHPRAPSLYAMAQAGEAVFVHAVATPYRERSHFSGQQVLESGGAAPFELKDGWLNRLLNVAGLSGAASGVTVPLSLLGSVPVPAYSRTIPRLYSEIRSGVASVWQQDPEFSVIWNQVLASESIVLNGTGDVPLVTGLLNSPVGPDVVSIDFIGWDTHTNEQYALLNPLGALDDFLGEVKAGTPDQWEDTLVVVCSEFGRSITTNGTGTDHGTGGMCMLLGAVKQWTDVAKPVLATWPGMAPAQLYDGRDLIPTRDLRSVLLAAVCRHFELDEEAVSATLFPATPAIVADTALMAG